MGEKPPFINSDGTPQAYSAGESPTYLGEMTGAGAELAPELLAEQQRTELRPGDVLCRRFEVVARLGFGGMGAVYRVRDLELGSDKALKVMLPSLLGSAGARDRFLSEVRVSQEMRHENIVTVYDLGEDTARGLRFFTMELVEGKTLHRHLADCGGRLPVPEALNIARQICDALECAHRTTIHRDLKPQNVMIRPDGSVKVLDFGLAKLMSPGRMTRSSMALGTAYYQAPEQSVHLRELDRRADLYSLGVMLYQMLTGEIPVGRFAPPSQAAPDVPKHLDPVVLRCLEPKMERRHPDAAALRADLVAARPRGAAFLLRVIVLAAMLLLVAGVVALGFRHFGGKYPPAAPPKSVASSPAVQTPPPPAPDSAADRARQEALAKAEVSRKLAEDKRREADTSEVREHAREEFSEGDRYLETARAAKAGSAAAVSAYESAAGKYADALLMAPVRKKAEEDRIAREAAEKADREAAAQRKAEEERQAREAAEKAEREAAAQRKAEEERQAQEVARKAEEEAKKSGGRAGEKRVFGGGEFAWIPSGSFEMGSPLSASRVASTYGGKEEWYGNAQPVHTVHFAQGFWMATREVTNRDFEAFANATGYKTDAEKEGSGWGRVFERSSFKWRDVKGITWRNPGWSTTPTQPVVLVSWNDAQAYIAWLNQKTGEGYRLPSEAEWEYACRAGTRTEFFWGDSAAGGEGYLNVTDQTKSPEGATFEDKFPFEDGHFFPAPAGSFKPNPWGLHDMLGNVWEWCQDWFHASYEGAPSDGSAWETPVGQYRVLRGGSWYGQPGRCRSSYRGIGLPGHHSDGIGFRLLRTP